ncbi:mitochondrial fission factor isoform X3 [Hyla sarda]|uniref:mitochondrial fission factor isoform X3 n=1 Tax=Hyla sarda TaxID=327740 RepID=UPI0024C2ADEF|nr:mitochondrial fission factor isoform X3 [Hyla sarda]
MNGAGFSPPAAEMAEISRMQYNIEYTEGISQRMRVPEKLQVASSNTEAESNLMADVPMPGVIMQVPERIVVTGQNEESSFSRPADLDLIQATPFEPLALKTPPRVLTLSERPLDFLDLERPTPVTPQNDEVRVTGRQKRERSISDSTVRHNGQLVRNDSMYTVTSLDSTMDGTPEDLSLVDAASLRRQIIKLNRRLLLLEEENKERVKREMVMYSITVAFWLLNSWFWFRR